MCTGMLEHYEEAGRLTQKGDAVRGPALDVKCVMSAACWTVSAGSKVVCRE
jgi:hypothetical protein